MTNAFKAVLMLDAFEHDWFCYGTHVIETDQHNFRVETDNVIAYYTIETLAKAYDDLEEKDKNDIYMNFLSNWK